MDFLDLTLLRQSDRNYLDRPIEPEKLTRILECARMAPSACNAQPWKVVVVDHPELGNRIADATSDRLLGMNHFTKQSPVHLVIVEEPGNYSSKLGGWIKKKHFPLIDIGIFAEHICLAAAAEGLGSCMIGWFDEPEIRKIVNIPKSKRVALIILIGYPGKETRKKIRKESTEIFCHNSYQ
jgi:nitroreductase